MYSLFTQGSEVNTLTAHTQLVLNWRESFDWDDVLFPFRYLLGLDVTKESIFLPQGI
jgi:hypothetical protein